MKEDLLWQNLLKQNFTDIKKLAAFLQWPNHFLQKIDFSPSFPLNLPLRLAQKIEKKTLSDPLVKQFVPLLKETVCTFTQNDPLEEKKFQTGRYIQKYPGRALLLSSDACAMHCRFCFRKQRFCKNPDPFFAKELLIIKKDKSLQEIILSGRDPLAIDTPSFSFLIRTLSSFDHIKRIRIHTRFILGFPERIQEPFLKILQNTNKQMLFVLHINHPHELDGEILRSIQKLQALKIPILNQSVLLKGVNDSVTILKNLAEMLMDNGILFYYLHLLDPVVGSSHFSVSKIQAQKLMRTLQKHVSGWGLPKLAQEIPGRLSKTLITF